MQPNPFSNPGGLLSMGPSSAGDGSNNRGTGNTAAAGAGQGTGAQFGGKC